ncbi:uncharacterized protein CCOS01_09575 [Colletotrichum costaricense]|uniref:Uncharacterized protein n=1 Tax=Colletotrichum costaricense TaxID=1209916 RepID=A0AAJ0DZW5_9PEZI|nr:uncharacterized protein CCOS01_09575 [Colletotrichum costaricense]KAK1524488.1 hypothetical protein CCOS01_09575 [Colletotrichum costaricense]
MPDLNSVPASPHPHSASRRSSSYQMPPPPLPVQSSDSSALNILPSNQNTVNHPPSNPPVGSPPMAPAVAASPPAFPEPSVSGPGPIRHPRPITASDLHMQLEKEQEAVVNRLTRELQLLRTAQNASVASNASSTSASNTTEAPDTHLLSGAAFSTPAVPSNSSRRHHRTASNASTRSQTAVAGSAAASTMSIPIARPPQPGRQDSVASRHSLSSSPAPSQHYLDPTSTSGLTYFQQQRLPQQHTGNTSVAATPGGSEAQLSPGLMTTTSRYEETALHRQELEKAKQENEVLKQRIRDLEKMVREKTAAAGRERSESTSSANASVAAAADATSVGVTTGGAGIAGSNRRPGGERERSLTAMSIASSVAVGVPDEEVQVGESAASSGVKP